MCKTKKKKRDKEGKKKCSCNCEVLLKEIKKVRSYIHNFLFCLFLFIFIIYLKHKSYSKHTERIYMRRGGAN